VLAHLGARAAEQSKLHPAPSIRRAAMMDPRGAERQARAARSSVLVRMSPASPPIEHGD
jgi:hypothetical protein